MQSHSTIASIGQITGKTQSAGAASVPRQIRVLMARQSDCRFFNRHFGLAPQRHRLLLQCVYPACADLKLRPSTCALAVAVLDQTVSRVRMDSDTMRLFAAAGLGLAVKFNESRCRSALAPYQRIMPLFGLAEVSQARLLQAESDVLRAVRFRVSMVTPWSFLAELLHTTRVEPDRAEAWAQPGTGFKSFLDLVFTVYRIVALNYSHNAVTSAGVAAVVVMLARKFCGARRLLPEHASLALGVEFRDMLRLLVECGAMLYCFDSRKFGVFSFENTLRQLAGQRN